jgi:hypothetical protein
VHYRNIPYDKNGAQVQKRMARQVQKQCVSLGVAMPQGKRDEERREILS